MIIDSHCHLDFSAFDADRGQVLEHAISLGVEKIIVPGVMRKSWGNIKRCCEQYPQLYPCYGLHPYFIEQHSEDDLQRLDRWLRDEHPVALGECGLDFFLKDLDRDKQHYYFEQQLDLALAHQLPVVIHARKSTEHIVQAIKKRPGLRGMIHSYSGSYEQAVKLIDLDFYLSFGGPVTNPNASKLRKLVQSLPLECLLVETDAPDQPIYQAASKRNEPACIVQVVEAIAELHDTDADEIAMVTRENAIQLFQLV